MATKSQHATSYCKLPRVLKRLREAAGLTQRDFGQKLCTPQSWVYNCESMNRRVDVTGFAARARACGRDPVEALAEFLGR